MTSPWLEGLVGEDFVLEVDARAAELMRDLNDLLDEHDATLPERCMAKMQFMFRRTVPTWVLEGR